jgi:hypothetical protein
MTDFKHAPYTVAPELDEDTAPPSCCDGLLCIRRYHVVAMLEGDDFPAVISLGRHWGTYAQALARLPEFAEEYPNARITSFWLALNLEIPEQLAAFERLALDTDREMGELQ